MSIAFIIILFKTPLKEKMRLQAEIKKISTQIRLVFIDSTSNNKGYAAGVNKGIIRVKKYYPDIVFIANPDISLRHISLNQLTKAAQYFDVWGFAMKQDKTLYYGGEIDIWRMSGGLITQKPTETYYPVDFVSGSLMGIKMEVVKEIGLINESYFMYYEDVEYCFRARKAGYTIGIDASVEYEHFETSQTNIFKKGLLKKNRLKFLWQYGTIQQKLYELARLPKTLYEEFLSNI